MEQTHECVMFAAVMRYRQNVVHIPRKYYETCPDFGTVYAAVKNMGKGGSTSIGDRASTRGTRNRGEEEKPKQEEKKMSQVPQSPERYYIEKGLLYLRPHVGARFGDRLCVPLSTV